METRCRKPPPTDPSTPSLGSSGRDDILRRRVVSELAIQTGIRLISFATVLKSVVSHRSSISKRADSVEVTVAPAAAIRWRAHSLSAGRRELTASWGTWTSNPWLNRSMTVCRTQTWVSIPVTMICWRPLSSMAPRRPSSRAHEKVSFEVGVSPRAVAP